MKFFTGLVAATALTLVTTLAQVQVHAQVPSSGVLRVSDVDGPYGAPEAPPPRPYGYGYDTERGPAPTLLPPVEVYAVLRENGFSPLGIPHLRGNVYTIAAIDRRGDDGRLVIDARNGRILRFVPADGPGFGFGLGLGPAYEEGAATPYGPQGYGPQGYGPQGYGPQGYGSNGALPPPTVIRGGPPRPPAAIPHVATRTVPLPKAAPPRGEAPVAAAKPVTTEPAPQAQAPQQAAAVQAKSVEAAPAQPTVGQAKPPPTILPTQDMPPAQGLE